MLLPLRLISNIIPANGLLSSLNATKGASIAIIWKETLILMGMTVVFRVLSGGNAVQLIRGNQYTTSISVIPCLLYLADGYRKWRKSR
jgi:hypothetical protein